MKKLWKQEWKYYLFFILATILCIYFVGNDGYLRPLFEHWLDYDGSEYYEVMRLNFCLQVLAGDINDLILKNVVLIIAVFLLLEKSILWWLEKEEDSRHFLQFLPVKRRKRFLFHFMMDSLLIFVTVIVYAIFLYLKASVFLQSLNMEIPWLCKSMCGESITIICYLLMLLGFFYFMESIFVSGFTKILGTVSGIGMLAYLLNALFMRNPGSNLIQNIYGFFSMEATGNSYYSVIKDNPFSKGTWLHARMQPTVFYNGELFEGYEEFALMDKAEPFYEQLNINRFFDFSHPSTYLGYAAAYLGLAIILTGLAIWLSEKQELSKEGFYFSFGKYIFSAMICGTFYSIAYIIDDVLWHKWVVVIADLILFVLLIYGMTPKKESKKQVVIQ